MLQIRSRDFLLIGLLLVCAIGLYLSFVKPQKTFVTDSITQTDAIAYPNEAVKIPSDKKIANTSIDAALTTEKLVKQPSSIVEQYRTMMGNPVEAAEVKNWFNRMGYAAFDSNEYSSYDQAALKKLAENGDVRAINLLAQKIYVDEGFEASKSLYFEGAARGSTDSISSIARMTYVENFNTYNSDDEKHKGSLEILAWSKVARLRGDQLVYLNGGKLFLDMEEIAISDKMETSSDELAQQYYHQLQAKRNELDLGEFDNSVPDSVKSFFDQLKKSQQ